MKLNDMKISTRLIIGMGSILAFVGGLGVFSWIQADLLWQQTRTMHEHPFQVSNAIGYLELSTDRLARYARDLILAQDEEETTAILQNIEIEKRNTGQQIDILSKLYLGPREDISNLQEALIKWNTVRDETISLIKAGKKAEAGIRIHSKGIQDIQRKEVASYILKIDNFAQNKADQLYRNARSFNNSLSRYLVVIITVILLLSLALAFFLLKSIRVPLSELNAAIEQFRQGKLDMRSGYHSSNEFGVLSSAFNSMADTIESQVQMDRQIAQLADVMLREAKSSTFSMELLRMLVEYTGSQIGAVYSLNKQKTEFELLESVGLGVCGRASFSAITREGELGTALASGKMQRISNIPEDTRFTFATVSGDFRPREIVTMPLLVGEETVAVVSLASIRGYSDGAVNLLEATVGSLSTWMNGVLIHRQLEEFSARLEEQNCELETQKKELTEMNTELEMQKKQLDEASRLKSAFLSNMSHELRTPLNSVIALSGVLNRRLSGTIPAEEYGYLGIIERNGRQLLSLINDILDLSRIEAGREEISLRLFSIKALVGEVVSMIEPQAQEKNIALINQMGDNLPQITSDPAKCRHILQNLIGNAVKFTEIGSVEVSVQHVGDELHIAVRDTGIGIATNQLPHVFEEFRQVDDSASRKYGGTGLGLAIVKRYAALIQGEVTVESILGKGSTFTFKLPLAISLQNAGEHAEIILLGDSDLANVGQVVDTMGQGRCILLVEDNESAVIQMKDILVGQGYRVELARNGHEALAQIEKSKPDAVILDLMMPEMDGFEALRIMRETEKDYPLPVLILTAKHVTKEELAFLKGNNIHQLIQKGDINRAELLSAISKMVAPRKKTAMSERTRTRKPRSGKPTVLVVEDNPDNMRTMRALLEDDYNLVEAENGHASVEKTREFKPDIILTDIALPGMDGIEALHEIRKDETLRRIPVIAITASAMKGDRETILSHGFDGYISKPIDEKLLRKTIREVLD